MVDYQPHLLGPGQGRALDFGKEGLRLWPKATLEPKGRAP